MVTIGDSLSDFASPHDGEGGEEDDNEETQQGRLSSNEEPDGMMGTFPKTVPHRLERFSQMQMKLNELTQPGSDDAADYFCQTDKMYSLSALLVPAVVQQQTDYDQRHPY